MKLKKVSGVIAAASALALVVGCSSGGGGTSAGGAAPVDTDTIRVTFEQPSTFDPALGMSLPDFLYARQSFDTLVRRDASGLVPGLATEWDETLTTANFTIRDDATCSDGTVITPAIVKDSLDRYAQSGGPIVPSTFDNQIPEITADDATGVVSINVENPLPGFVARMAVATTGIICPTGLADLEGLADGHIDGAESGPYTLVAQDPGVRYTYELREDYDQWPAWTEVEGTPASTLEVILSPDPTATTNLLFDGQLDIGKIMADSTARFENQEGFSYQDFLFSDYVLMFNQREGSIFTDPALRKAVAQVIDRDELKTVAMESFGEAATTFASSQSMCVTGDDSALIPTNMDAASKVLDGVNIRLIGPQIVGTNGAGNVYVQERLRAAGANVELQNVDVGTWISTVAGEPNAWDLTVYAELDFAGSLASPLAAYIGPSPENGGGNIGDVHVPAVEEAYSAAMATEDQAEHCALLNEAADELVSGAYAVPLMTDVFIYGYSDDFSVYMPGGSLDDHQFRIVG